MLTIPRETARRLFQLAYWRKADPSDVLVELILRAYREASEREGIRTFRCICQKNERALTQPQEGNADG